MLFCDCQAKISDRSGRTTEEVVAQVSVSSRRYGRNSSEGADAFERFQAANRRIEGLSAHGEIRA